jgi:predicted transposase/invertase (TIGR01784 family)
MDYNENTMKTLAQQFIRQGKKEGKKEEKRETARLMLMDDCSIEMVMKYTGLSEEEIKSLMN